MVERIASTGLRKERLEAFDCGVIKSHHNHPLDVMRAHLEVRIFILLFNHEIQDGVHVIDEAGLERQHAVLIFETSVRH